jgi:hypothetical protein
MRVAKQRADIPRQVGSARQRQTWTGTIEIQCRTPTEEQVRVWREFWSEQYARLVSDRG